VALLDLPTWTVPPDWRNPVLERLEWKASVLASQSGAEQRFGLRIAPRRTFEFGVTVMSRERTLLDLSLGRVGMGEWYLPIWHDGAPLTAAAASGATTLACDTTHREFRAGDAALVRGRDGLTTETVEIASVATGSLGLVGAGLLSDWPAGTRIYPARRARMLDKSGMSRKADRAMTGNVLFLCTEPDDWPEMDWPVLYGGRGVLTYRPDESADLTMEYSRLASMFDDELSAPAVVDIADIGFTLQQQNFWMHGRADHAELRSIFYALRGRQRPVWLPTHYADLDLAQAASGASLVAARCGFVDYGGPRTGRQHIRIERTDGTASHHLITGASATVGGDESLTIDPALSSPLAVAGVRRISFMQLARLDSDTIEFSHTTDSDGLTTVATAFRSTPETRVATSYEPTPLPNSTQTAWLCGEEAPPTSGFNPPVFAFADIASVASGAGGTVNASPLGSAYTMPQPGVAFIASFSDSASAAPEDTGFALVASVTAGGSNQLRVWAKRYASGETVPDTVNLTFGSAAGTPSKRAVALVVIRNVATDLPAYTAVATTTGTTSLVLPGLTAPSTYMAVHFVSVSGPSCIQNNYSGWFNATNGGDDIGGGEQMSFAVNVQRNFYGGLTPGLTVPLFFGSQTAGAAISLVVRGTP
jgi:hypothetical protein